MDTISTGLNAVIMQDGKTVAFSSKTLTTSERRYANIERELVAIVWGAEKFYTYVYRRRLEQIINYWSQYSAKPAAPPRLQRMLLKLSKYDLDVRYVSR